MIVNARKEADVVNPDTDSYFELDIYLPSLKLAFEYQVYSTLFILFFLCIFRLFIYFFLFLGKTSFCCHGYFVSISKRDSRKRCKETRSSQG